MFINNNPMPKSSFLSLEKDMQLISNMMLKNPRLKKLLFYTTPHCLSMPAVSDDDAIAMFGKNIRLVPKIYVDNNVLNYIIINFDQFSPNATNPEFRDNVISFDIICHFDQWSMIDFQLRPFKIAAEIDSMFNGAKLTGIGTLNFLGANQMIINDEYAGITLMYFATHGDEDKINMPTPQDQAQFELDFQEMLESQ